MRKEITTEIMDIVNAERKAREYSNLVVRKSRKEKAKAKLALSIIGSAFLSLPLFYAMLFIVTII